MKIGSPRVDPRPLARGTTALPWSLWLVLASLPVVTAAEPHGGARSGLCRAAGAQLAVTQPWALWSDSCCTSCCGWLKCQTWTLWLRMTYFNDQNASEGWPVSQERSHLCFSSSPLSSTCVWEVCLFLLIFQFWCNSAAVGETPYWSITWFCSTFMWEPASAFMWEGRGKTAKALLSKGGWATLRRKWKVEVELENCGKTKVKSHT